MLHSHKSDDLSIGLQIICQWVILLEMFPVRKEKIKIKLFHRINCIYYRTMRCFDFAIRSILESILILQSKT